MKKSMKSFKAISEKKKTTVKGGGLNWSYRVSGGCNFCGDDNKDH